MKTTELFFIETKSKLGQQINPAPLIGASRAEDMLPLSRQELEQHELGFFVTAGLSLGDGKRLPAIGYAACRRIIDSPLLLDDPAADTPQRFALIGSLYIDKSIRGQKVGQALIRHVTEQTFQRYPVADACIAACNTKAVPSFAAGYHECELAPATADLVTSSIDKISVMVTRAQWQALQACTIEPND